MMEDKDAFMFDEEGEEATNFDAEQGSEDWGDYEPEKKSGSKRLLYMLLLLVVLAGGAVYVLFLSPEDGPSPPVNVVTVPRNPNIAPMPKPMDKPMPKPVASQSDAVSIPTAPPATPAPVAEKPVSAAVEPASTLAAAPVPVAPAVDKVEPEPKLLEASVPKPEQIMVKPNLFEPKVAAKPVVAGAYTLSAGAFVLQSSVDGVLKKIRKLGYEPQIQKINREIDMTRLLVGVYPAEIAEQKLREVKKVTADAFTLNKGGQTAVYAGSYLVLDKARIFADTTLSENGIRVTEEAAKVNRTLQRVTFGSFTNQEEALKVSRSAAGKGLDVKPVKN